jgi:hypothetical protein
VAIASLLLIAAEIVATVVASSGLVLTLGVGAMFFGMGSAFLAGAIAVAPASPS